jgi:hypothetical protein
MLYQLPEKEADPLGVVFQTQDFYPNEFQLCQEVSKVPRPLIEVLDLRPCFINSLRSFSLGKKAQLLTFPVR